MQRYGNHGSGIEIPVLRPPQVLQTVVPRRRSCCGVVWSGRRRRGSHCRGRVERGVGFVDDANSCAGDSPFRTERGVEPEDT